MFSYNQTISWFERKQENVWIVMIEAAQERTCVCVSLYERERKGRGKWDELNEKSGSLLGEEKIIS